MLTNEKKFDFQKLRAVLTGGMVATEPKSLCDNIVVAYNLKSLKMFIQRHSQRPKGV